MRHSFELSMLMVLDESMIAACLSGEVVRVLHPVVVLAVQNIATSLNFGLVVDWFFIAVKDNEAMMRLSIVGSFEQRLLKSFIRIFGFSMNNMGYSSIVQFEWVNIY